MKWVKCEDELPYISDRSVLAYFSEKGCIDMVHVEDYFKDITAGIIGGIQQYTKWYLKQKVTHWMEMPESPK